MAFNLHHPFNWHPLGLLGPKQSDLAKEAQELAKLGRLDAEEERLVAQEGELMQKLRVLTPQVLPHLQAVRQHTLEARRGLSMGRHDIYAREAEFARQEEAKIDNAMRLEWLNVKIY